VSSRRRQRKTSEEEFLPAARESVKQESILDAIAKKENLTVDPGEAGPRL